MTTVETTIEELPGPKVRLVLESLFDAIYDNVPYDDVRANAKGVEDMRTLLDLDLEKIGDKELSEEDSILLGRAILLHCASDPGLSGFVEEAVAEVQKEDRMLLGTALALALVVNLTLVVATTEIKARKGADGKTTWSFTKKVAPLDVLKAIVNPVADLAAKLLPVAPGG